jgi:hypothetical protein
MSEDTLTLAVSFTFDPPSGLYYGTLENGARFAITPMNVSGKLGANLDLLRQMTIRERGGHAARPHPASGDFGKSEETRLVEEAIAAGRLTKLSKTGKPVVTLEELGL